MRRAFWLALATGCGPVTPSQLSFTPPAVLAQNLERFDAPSAVVRIVSLTGPIDDPPVDAPGVDGGTPDGGYDPTHAGDSLVFESEAMALDGGALELFVDLEPGDYLAYCLYQDQRASGTLLYLVEAHTAPFTVFPETATDTYSGGSQSSFDHDGDSFSNLDEIVTLDSDPEATSVVWSVPMPGYEWSRVEWLDNGLLLVTNIPMPGETLGVGMLAVDPADGAVVWQEDTAAAPLVEGGSIVSLHRELAAEGIRARRFDAFTGALLAESPPTPTNIGIDTLSLGLVRLGSGAYAFQANGELYVVADDLGGLSHYSIDAASGCDSLVGPTYGNRATLDVLVFGIASGSCFGTTVTQQPSQTLVALDTSDGTPSVSWSVGDVTFLSGDADCMIATADTLYVNLGNAVLALGPADGNHLRWQAVLSDDAGRCDQSPAPLVTGSGDLLAITLDGRLVRLDAASGESEATLNLSTTNFGRHAPAAGTLDGRVVVPGTTGALPTIGGFRPLIVDAESLDVVGVGPAFDLEGTGAFGPSSTTAAVAADATTLYFMQMDDAGVCSLVATAITAVP